jgi:hypothetical protein
MIQEDRKLLLEYLSAAIPYGVICKVNGRPKKLISIAPTRKYCFEFDNGEFLPYHYEIEDALPYLRKTSSMTKKEREELESLGWRADELDDNKPWDLNGNIENVTAGIKWLLKHHFDFMGLISNGLAITVTENNDPYRQYLVITQPILDYIKKNASNFENPMPTLGEKWIIDGEFTYSGVCNGQPVVEIHKATGEFMRLPKSICVKTGHQ